MCTTPSLTMRFCFFFLGAAGFSPAAGGAVFAMLVPHARSGLLRRVLLAGDRTPRPLPGARVAVRALAVHGQVAAVPQPAIRAEIHVALDVHRHVAPQITFHLEVLIDDLAA